MMVRRFCLGKTNECALLESAIVDVLIVNVALFQYDSNQETGERNVIVDR